MLQYISGNGSSTCTSYSPLHRLTSCRKINNQIKRGLQRVQAYFSSYDNFLPEVVFASPTHQSRPNFSPSLSSHRQKYFDWFSSTSSPLKAIRITYFEFMPSLVVIYSLLALRADAVGITLAGLRIQNVYAICFVPHQQINLPRPKVLMTKTNRELV